MKDLFVSDTFKDISRRSLVIPFAIVISSHFKKTSLDGLSKSAEKLSLDEQIGKPILETFFNRHLKFIVLN